MSCHPLLAPMLLTVIILICPMLITVIFMFFVPMLLYCHRHHLNLLCCSLSSSYLLPRFSITPSWDKRWNPKRWSHFVIDWFCSFQSKISFWKVNTLYEFIITWWFWAAVLVTTFCHVLNCDLLASWRTNWDKPCLWCESNFCSNWEQQQKVIGLWESYLASLGHPDFVFYGYVQTFGKQSVPDKLHCPSRSFNCLINL